MSALSKRIRRNVVAYFPGGGGVVTPPEPTDFTLWSNPRTWVDGSDDPENVPQPGETFNIGVNSVIKVDVNPDTGKVDVYGTVIIPNDRDTTISFRGWTFKAGSKLIYGNGVPGGYTRKCRWQFQGDITGTTPRMVTASNGTQPVQMGFNNSGTDRTLMFEEGSQIFGGPPLDTKHHWRLAAHVQIGDVAVKLRESVMAKQGEVFVIGTTDWNGQSLSEEMTVAVDSSGDTVTFTSAFTKFHWGRMQWVTKTAKRQGHMSLVDEGWRPANDAPYTFDESAHVVRNTRNIVVDGSFDGDKGGRVMTHAHSGTQDFNGWEFYRTGAKGLQQWYGGVHHHMSSYEMPDGMNSPSNGNYIGGSLESSLCSGHFVRNCSVHHSNNRGFVPHGANGVTYDGNTGYDIIGSFLFIEEGSSRKCTINNNHCILIKAAVAPYVLQNFDEDSENFTSVLARASGFWLTNPDNVVTNNSCGDCVTGFWNAFTNRNPDKGGGYSGFGCFGLSKNIPFAPGGMDILQWDNNECYANSKKGILTDFAQSDEAGNVSSDQYPYTNSPADANVQTLKRARIWKGMQGYQNRVRLVQYLNFSCSNVCGSFANGATLSHSTAPNGLGICESLNVTPRPTANVATYDAVAMSYNGSLVFPGWIVVGYTTQSVGADDEPGGNNGAGLFTARAAFKMWSEYLYPKTGWTHRCPGIELLNSDFAWRTPPDWMISEAPYNIVRSTPKYTGDLAGSAVMYDDYLGDGTTGKTWTYNIPFCTYGSTGQIDPLPIGKNNGILINETMFGVGDSLEGVRQYDNIFYDPATSVKATRDTRRLDPSTLAEVGHWLAPAGPAFTSPGGVGFQHFPVMEGGVYKSISPDIPQLYWQEVVYGAATTGKKFIRGVPFTGSKTAKVAAGTGGGDMGAGNDYYATPVAVQVGVARRYTPAASLADLISGAPNRFWQDKPNNYVWWSFEGGITSTNPAPEGTDMFDFHPIIVSISAVS